MNTFMTHSPGNDYIFQIFIIIFNLRKKDNYSSHPDVMRYGWKVFPKVNIKK